MLRLNTFAVTVICYDNKPLPSKMFNISAGQCVWHTNYVYIKLEAQLVSVHANLHFLLALAHSLISPSLHRTFSLTHSLSLYIYIIIAVPQMPNTQPRLMPSSNFDFSSELKTAGWSWSSCLTFRGVHTHTHTHTHIHTALTHTGTHIALTHTQAWHPEACTHEKSMLALGNTRA